MRIVTPEQIQRERVRNWIRSEQGRTNKKQKDIAELLHVEQSNVSKRINTGSFKAFELLLMCEKLDFDLTRI